MTPGGTNLHRLVTDGSDIGQRMVRKAGQRDCWENKPSWNDSPSFLWLFHQRIEAGVDHHNGLFLFGNIGSSKRRNLLDGDIRHCMGVSKVIIDSLTVCWVVGHFDGW